jgi:RNA polymerase sigma-70 factor, ECF subfamily
VFGALYREHFPSTRSFFLRRGFREAEADDLAQRVFLEAWKSRSQYRGEGAVAAWLATVAASVYKNELRSRQTLRRGRQDVALNEELHDSGEPPVFTMAETPADRKAIESETRELIGRAVERLPDGMRACLELHLGGQLTYRQIADTLGVALGTVQSQIHDGKKAVLALLRRDADDWKR